MKVRSPIAAGRFYPAYENECVSDINDCISRACDIPKSEYPVIAGIVPHAGWFFSGAAAVKVFLAAIESGDVETFIFLGACHASFSRGFDVYDGDGWQSPFGIAKINREISEAIAESHPNARFNNEPHMHEHSIEVQVPFVQYLSGDSTIAAVSVPPVDQAPEFGESLADVVNDYAGGRAVVIASTDLTHYGSSYGFTPAGKGEEGVKWAAEQNDKKFIDLALKMDSSALLEHANAMQAACGGGAAAAAVSFAAAMGRRNGVLLEQTNSARIMRERLGRESSDSVGYAAIVY
ncbi:Memo-like protein [Limihaloglobus sulfuriphilus]|uniref:Memo-like protein n=1 Tax=Limihaloglobus sulfuriphilus TaxID=1851148 RepID=A0A1Q2MI77_9BACT|nr:AmmeMemoRadiSam system protein B [Limihaloglobus sulfuriphilus]AQQ72359.1 Memo-like protein [Limihaloglobus sulfuriphilus]